MAGKKFEAGLAGGITEAGLEVPGKREYRPPKSLKQLILEDEKPETEIYRRLIALWPEISDNRLREIITGVDGERLRKILDLAETTGKPVQYYEEFLAPSLDYSLHLRLDAIYRYWRFILPKIEPLLEKINADLSASWQYTIDDRKYHGQLSLFLDGQQKPLRLFERIGGRPIIGSPYESWPCIETIKNHIKATQEGISSLLETQVDLTARALELNTLIERFRELQNSFFRLDPLSGVNFPPKFAKTIGHIKKKIIYGNVFTLGCAWCPPRKHEIVQIIILEPRKGGEAHG
ncbi:MAG: hypothetical protein QXG35_10050 [Nitrososphaerota archaeon]